MVIRGNIRGNGQQLGAYLLREGGNDQIRILDVAGRANATDAYLHQTLYAMSLTAELTKSQKGLFHAQINPAYAEDRRMTDADWFKAADILGKELGYEGQRRVIVLHTKKNRTHAHVVFERYDQKTGRVIDNKFSRLAQDRARKEMERVFNHQPTPHRNQHRPELKEKLTTLWQETETGVEFMQKVQESGYLLAEGVPRHPFMVVDENGRSFDLVRQLKGVRIKEVRERMRHVDLIPEKEAIELMRQRQEGGSDASKAERQSDHDMAKRTAAAFWDNKQDSTENTEAQSRQRMRRVAASFLQSADEMTKDVEDDSPEKKKNLAGAYNSNGDELTASRQDRGEKQQPKNGTDLAEQDIEQAKTHQATREKPWATLQAFMQAEDEILVDTRLARDRQRRQDNARQFFDNQDALNADQTQPDQITHPATSSTDHAEPTGTWPDDERVQKLMQEQKESRKRNQQRGKRRSR
ncbi:hypothetical protein BN8_05879 [Fibrisoma limi BUZ 3]|uniref:MobA/VirD2-like nuclease domain-containing protein n=1 Tax=Fibrisoma limi BUZ 3 TaxID=1185876 RepID=I2GRK5_9BACT|nr:relaxase/mobilization nuclease domain-containing protein [Fibrisoma limi]CCH56533.1 hypothetical protein BN8_05879 [Fibrisoma limi BUZ 3]